MQKRGKNMDKLKRLIRLMTSSQSLPEQCRDHALIGNYIDHRECHVEPDWLLIYKKTDKSLILERTGSHSDLFK